MTRLCLLIKTKKQTEMEQLRNVDTRKTSQNVELKKGVGIKGLSGEGEEGLSYSAGEQTRREGNIGTERESRAGSGRVQPTTRRDVGAYVCTCGSDD